MLLAIFKACILRKGTQLLSRHARQSRETAMDRYGSIHCRSVNLWIALTPAMHTTDIALGTKSALQHGFIIGAHELSMLMQLRPCAEVSSSTTGFMQCHSRLEKCTEP